ncbi:hypothetical protein Tco_0970699 [Tanacetum coccineum]
MVVPSAGAKHCELRIKISDAPLRGWCQGPLGCYGCHPPRNSGALPNLVPNSIFLTFFSMARAYGTTTPSALSEIYALFLETRKKPLTPRRNLTSLQDQILDHVSSLKALIKQHNKRSETLIEPIHLSFGDEDGSDKGKCVDKGVGDAEDEDLWKPYKEVLRSPFTRRIIEFSAPKHLMLIGVVM